MRTIAIYYPNIFYSFRYKFFLYNTYYYIFKNDFNQNAFAYRELIKRQIQLAKSHGIYGFAIYFYWFGGKTVFDKPLRIIYHLRINFNFMLIWKNENLINYKNEIVLKEKYNKNDPKNFILDIKKYLLSDRYIKIEGKPIIGIYKPKNIPDLKQNLLIWRRTTKIYKIDIFIISALNDLNFIEKNNLKLFDAAYISPSNDLFKGLIKNTRENYYYYYGLFYSYIMKNEKFENVPIFKGNIIDWDNSPIEKNSTIFADYSHEKFYLMNQILIDWTNKSYNESYKLYFINAWNNYFDSSYLEPNEKNGYGSINSLSKALFNLSYKIINYNLLNLTKYSKVAVQVHIFYDDLVKEIINKINNIPVNFDLYITTDNDKKYKKIQIYIQKYSKASNNIIELFENKGRDVLPFIFQIGKVINKYKYLCHIHSKKHRASPIYGRGWRIYLYNNLLGSKQIIYEILSDFENYEKLGFIFPENFYKCVHSTLFSNILIIQSMNYLIDQFFPGYKIANKYFDFPAGNMFWARSIAVYQMFKIDIIKKFLSNKKTTKEIYAIERIWLFIVKLNGYYYKKYFKYYK